MVPGAAQGIADDQALGERTSVVRALRARRVDGLPTADEDHRLPVGVTEHGDPLGELAHRHAGREIRSRQRLGVSCAHQGELAGIGRPQGSQYTRCPARAMPR